MRITFPISVGFYFSEICGNKITVYIIPNTQVRETDAGLFDESLRDDLTSVLQVLNDREREVITKCFGIGMPERTLDEIGQEMGIGRECVRQLRETVLRKLRSQNCRERSTD